jgi:hypothetical protein
MVPCVLLAVLVALAVPAAGAQVHGDPAADDGARAGAIQVVVSLEERRLWVLAGEDTLRSATVAVPSGVTLEYDGRRWRFDMPRGRHQVIGKKADPVWQPPDWHYAEVARDHGLRVRRLAPRGTTLRDGRRLVVRDSVVGIEPADGGPFEPLPPEEHVVFDGVLFIPPFGTRNRRLEGELGRYALDLGDGFLLHGTRDPDSIGTASTHGCIRLSDEDVEWLFSHVPVGAPVLVR